MASAGSATTRPESQPIEIPRIPVQRVLFPGTGGSSEASSSVAASPPAAIWQNPADVGAVSPQAADSVDSPGRRLGPVRLNNEQWRELLGDCGITRGYNLEVDSLVQAAAPLFSVTSSAELPNYQTMRDVYERVDCVYGEAQRAAVLSNYTKLSGAVDVQVPYASAQLDFERSRTQEASRKDVEQLLTACKSWNTYKVKVFVPQTLKASNPLLEVHPDFSARVRTALQLSAEVARDELEKIWSEYGHFFFAHYTLGAQLVCDIRQSVEVTSLEDKKEKAIAFRGKVDAEFCAVKAGIMAGMEKGESSQHSEEHRKEAQGMSSHVHGGNTDIFDSEGFAKWTMTVGDYKLWRIVHMQNIMPIWSLLPTADRAKVENILKGKYSSGVQVLAAGERLTCNVLASPPKKERHKPEYTSFEAMRYEPTTTVWYKQKEVDGFEGFTEVPAAFCGIMGFSAKTAEDNFRILLPDLPSIPASCREHSCWPAIKTTKTNLQLGIATRLYSKVLHAEVAWLAIASQGVVTGQVLRSQGLEVITRVSKPHEPFSALHNAPPRDDLRYGVIKSVRVRVPFPEGSFVGEPKVCIALRELDVICWNGTRLLAEVVKVTSAYFELDVFTWETKSRKGNIYQADYSYIAFETKLPTSSSLAQPIGNFVRHGVWPEFSSQALKIPSKSKHGKELDFSKVISATISFDPPFPSRTTPQLFAAIVGMHTHKEGSQAMQVVVGPSDGGNPHEDFKLQLGTHEESVVQGFQVQWIAILP